MLSAAATVILAIATSTDESVVRAWFDAEWERVNNTLPSLQVGWTYEDYRRESDAWINQASEAVRREPNHPLRPRLERALRHARGEPTRSRYRWWCDGTRWRFGVDYEAPDLFSDTATDGERSWMLGPDSITRFLPRDEARRAKQPSGEDRIGSALPMLSDLFLGGFGAGTYSKVVPTEFAWDGVEWRAIARSAAKPDAKATYLVRYQGTWDAQANRGFTSFYEAVYEATDATQPPRVVERVEIGRPLRLGEKVWAAESVTVRDERGVVTRRLASPRLLELIDVRAAVATPTPGASDLVRGSIPSSVQVTDYSNAPSLAAQSDGLTIGGDAQREHRTLVRWIGYCVFAAGIVGIGLGIVHRVRKRML